MEIEEGMWEWKVSPSHGQGYLADQSFSAEGAVATINWGKQRCEHGLVTHQSGNTINISWIPCEGHTKGPSRQTSLQRFLPEVPRTRERAGQGL